MGSILAETTAAEKIEKIFNPVRDLFASIFFVSVGMLISPETIVQYKWPVLIITGLTLTGKLFSSFLGALISGLPLKQSIQVGMSMAQIGEFAFIVATLGMSLGVISDFLFPVAVGVSAITTFTTPYLIKFSEPVYNYVEKRLPDFIKRRLANYAASAQNIQAESKWKVVLMGYIKILITNGIILFGLMLLSVRVFLPFLNANIGNGFIGSLITLIVSLGIASPFLWAFVARRPDSTAYKELWLQEKYNKGPLLMVEIIRDVLAILFIGFWMDRLFATFIGMLIAVPVITVILVLFSKRIKRFYKRIETRFLANLNQREIAEEKSRPELFSYASGLSSWDAHLVDLEVNPHALYIGRHLLELGWREKYGINIAYIKRGSKIIYAPKRHDRLLPFDHIGVIATDDQMNSFMTEFERVESSEIVESNLDDVVLFKMVIDEKNKLRGESIRGSQIREKTNGLVVGIERKNQRILNPESDTVFEWGDINWIVGDRKKLNSITHPTGLPA